MENGSRNLRIIEQFNNSVRAKKGKKMKPIIIVHYNRILSPSQKNIFIDTIENESGCTDVIFDGLVKSFSVLTNSNDEQFILIERKEVK